MISVKNNFWQVKERDHVLSELIFFVVKLIGLVFLLYLAAGGHPGGAKIKFSELTTASNHKENVLVAKKMRWGVQQERM
ncbi:MAG: hypothetical protein D3910_06135 [Candidatus Electrothrix sp. ATG2]|nr:hypothetical protein [Candidatus Electrothrix sp. ATG2]